MKIELLVIEGCPNSGPARALLQDCMDALGITERITVVPVDSDEDARRQAFPGSPTIRVEDMDVAPLPEAIKGSLTCRTYQVGGRLQGLPDKAWVMAALSNAAGKRLAAPSQWTRRTTWTAALLGLLASACCWLPLALAGAGVAGGAVGAKVAWLRPWALGGLALMLLGIPGWWAHRRLKVSGDCCGVSARFPAFPAAVLMLSFLGAWTAPRLLERPPASPTHGAPAGGALLVLSTPQYDCAACVGTLPEQMSKTPGVASVQMDYERRETRIAFKPGADASSILAQWKRDLGFEGAASQQTP